MRIIRHLAFGLTLSLLISAAAWAQETRPTSSTIFGDTGLWFVPLGETTPKGTWSGAVALVNFDRSEGFSDITDIGGMFAFGATDRIELFGSMSYRRIDADLVPVARNGQPQDYLINKGWSTGIGDVNVGAKFNLLSQATSNGYAAALRVMAKLPTASKDDGLGTGKPDFQFDLIGSREFGEKVELAASAGIRLRGKPDGYNLTPGFKWGIGGAYPSRSKFRVVAEMVGEALFDQAQTFTGTPIGTAGGPPREWDPDATRDLFGGFQFHSSKGMFFGAGVSYTASYYLHRRDFLTSEDSDFDRLGLQVRLGYHPSGVRNYAPPPPAPPVTAVNPGPPPNRPPTVKARCEPCTVQVGRASTVSADAQDPDGDTLRYKWGSPTGSFANANDRQTQWTAPGQPGAVPVTVTVDDGKGGTASDTITIQVVAPPRKEYTFEDVHFDFDRYSLRAEATRILDEAIKAMSEDPNLRITVEGHTCNIGTTEYNLALGERRSNAVRDYLASRGVAASRLQSVSYGEERPKHDNSREETRRLNRRAALTIRMQ